MNRPAKPAQDSGAAYGNPPLPFIYGLVRNSIVLLVRLMFNPHFRSEGMEAASDGPLIILANHQAYPDPALAAMAMPHRRINFVVSASFFRKPLVGRTLQNCGAIPKLQFRTDMRAVRAMLRVLARGGVLGIFPEATRSLDGRPAPFDDATARLIKHSGSAVATVRINGSYLSWPRWSKSGIRPGRIEAKANLLLTSEESRTLPLAEIHRRICAALAYDDYDWQRQARVRFHSFRPALGLHLLLHRCPACDREKALVSDAHRLVCRFCGNGARMDRYGLLQPLTADSRIFPDPAAWHAWQIERQRAAMSDAGADCCSSPVRACRTQGTRSWEPWDNGVLSLTSNGFRYESSSGTGIPALTFPLPSGGLSIGIGAHLELSTADDSYRFLFADVQEAIRVADQVAALTAAPAI